MSEKFITLKLDKLSLNVYNISVDTNSLMFLPVTNLFRDIVSKNIKDLSNDLTGEVYEIIINLIESYIKTLDITSYNVDRDNGEIIINNLTHNIPSYTVSYINLLCESLTNKGLPNFGITTTISLEEDKFKINLNLATETPIEFVGLEQLTEINRKATDSRNNIFNNYSIYNIEKFSEVYSDEMYTIDYETIKENFESNLTKTIKDSLKLNKDEFLSQNPEYNNLIIQDLTRYVLLWDEVDKDVKYLDVSNKIIIDTNKEIEELNLEKLAIFYNSKFYHKKNKQAKEINDEESISIKTRLRFTDGSSTDNSSVSTKSLDESSGDSDIYKINIVVPFRNTPLRPEIANIPGQDRNAQLKQFKDYMTGKNSFIQKVTNKLFEQGITNEINITIVEQSQDGKRFNRGALLNVGFLEDNTNDKYDVYIFHDVDLLPNDSMIDIYATRYTNRDIVHFAAGWNRYKGEGYLGGVTLIGSEIFREMNGFPNDYWGWGGEDDELLRRIQKINAIGIIQRIENDDPYTDLEGIETADEKRQILKKDPLSLDNIIKNEQRDLHESTWRTNGLNMHISLEETFYKIDSTEQDNGINTYKVSLDYDKIKPSIDESIRKDLFKN